MDSNREQIIDARTELDKVRNSVKKARERFENANIEEPIHYGKWQGAENSLARQDIIIAIKN